MMPALSQGTYRLKIEKLIRRKMNGLYQFPDVQKTAAVTNSRHFVALSQRQNDTMRGLTQFYGNFVRSNRAGISDYFSRFIAVY
jgi:hypothetical protein